VSGYPGKLRCAHIVTTPGRRSRGLAAVVVPVGSPAEPPAEPDTVVAVDATTGAIGHVVSVGRDPLLLTAAGGRVWALNVADGTLSMIDSDSGTEKRLSLRETVGVTSGGGAVWVAHDGDRLALDDRTGNVMKTFRLGDKRLFRLRDSGFLAFGGNSLWLTLPVLGQPNRRQQLARARVAIPRDPAVPLAAGKYVWIAGRIDNTLTRIAQGSARTRAVSLDALPFGIASGAGSLWVAHDFRTVDLADRSAIAPRLARIKLGQRTRGVAFGRGRVWATTETDLVAVDPGSNRIVRRIRLSAPRQDDGPIGVAVLGGTVWDSVE
jgi:hypothetical protein